jgi:hypothetical protein
MKRLIGAGLVAVLSAAAPAFANHGDPAVGVDERQHRLGQRIEQGWRSGELTRPEYRRLSHELREIDRAERYYRADGVLSTRERNELHVRLDDLSREIHRERRDVERSHGPYNYDYHTYRRF